MPFCSALENHCCIDVRLNYRPCCHFDQALNQRFPIHLYSYKDYKSSDFFTDLKKQMKEGWAPGCFKCKHAEDRGIKSLRENYNEKFSGQSDKLEFIDISLSNTCNLTCKMCNNTYSSKWQSILDKNGKMKDFGFPAVVKSKDEISVKHIFNNLRLDDLKEIKYLGGEPFITKEFKELINFLKKEKIIHKISFRCNTNCTFFPNKMLKDLLLFKSIRIDLSIDGINDLCDFVRTGKDWNQVSRVVDQWTHQRDINKEKITLNLHHTCNAYNLHQNNLIADFAKEKNLKFNYYILSEPNYLDISVLPKNYVYELIESKKLTDNKIIKILLDREKFDTDLWQKFVNYTKTTDKILKTDIKKVIPELAKYII